MDYEKLGKDIFKDYPEIKWFNMEGVFEISKNIRYILRTKYNGTIENVSEIKGYTGTVISIYGKVLCSQHFPFYELFGSRLYVKGGMGLEEVVWSNDPKTDVLKGYVDKVIGYAKLWVKEKPAMENPVDTLTYSQNICFDNNFKQKCRLVENETLGELKCVFRDRSGKLVEMIVTNKRIGMRFLKTMENPYQKEIAEYEEKEN